jgi:uncharacterized membrane protein HdeD (DUF308 family)
MQQQFDVFVGEAPDVLAVHWGLPLGLGAILVVLGVLAIIYAQAATTISVRILGVLLMVSSLSVFAFGVSLAGFWTEFFVHVIWAALILIAGLMLVTRPAVGAVAVTMLLAIAFIVSGVMSISFALSAHVDNLWLYLFEGFVSIVIGTMLWIGRPFSSMWAIGTLVGIDLVFKGSAIFFLGWSLRAISA